MDHCFYLQSVVEAAEESERGEPSPKTSSVFLHLTFGMKGSCRPPEDAIADWKQCSPTVGLGFTQHPKGGCSVINKYG